MMGKNTRGLFLEQSVGPPSCTTNHELLHLNYSNASVRDYTYVIGVTPLILRHMSIPTSLLKPHPKLDIRVS
ncbi:hypothetical protein M0802_004283 [Mischocyttarus mexicanus]|nr:hypothetical protein M0802_004283 [Mischocyttarus mexicanus]